MSWPFSQILDYLELAVTPNRTSYPDRAPVRLDITIANRFSGSYEAPVGYSNRSAHIRFMERSGWGLFVITLGALFQNQYPLVIGAGQSIKTSLRLSPSRLASRTEILHYELAPNVRTFQVFLPLADEDAEGYRNMLAANSEGVTIHDSWVLGR